MVCTQRETAIKRTDRYHKKKINPFYKVIFCLLLSLYDIAIVFHVCCLIVNIINDKLFMLKFK